MSSPTTDADASLIQPPTDAHPPAASDATPAIAISISEPANVAASGNDAAPTSAATAPSAIASSTLTPPAAAPSSSSPSSAASVAPPPAAAASVAPPIPDESLTPDQLRAKKLFDRWQKTFLGAIDKQSEDYILSMLREGEDLIRDGLLDLNRTIKPASGSTFLHTVAWFQKSRLIEWLLQHGANPNQGNNKGNTPLHLLCEQANKGDVAIQCIQLLVNYGGDVGVKDGGAENPQSSVEKAAAVGVDILTAINYDKHKEFLAKKNAAASGGDSSQENSDSSAAPPVISEAEMKAQQEKARLVYRKLSTLFLGLEAEGVSQAVDDAIIRILTTNMKLIHTGVLDLNRPPLNAANSEEEQAKDRKTFLHYAVLARRPEILRVLLLGLNEAQLSTPDENGETPLHHAMSKIDEGRHGPTIVGLLIDSGASLTAASYLKGLTPIQMLPATTPPEVKSWLTIQLAKPRSQRGVAGATNGKLGVGGGNRPTSAGAASSLADRQDRVSARAMIARMGSNLGMPSSAATVAPNSKSALGLIQKLGGATAHFSPLSSKRSTARHSGGAGTGLAAALQQIMAAKSAASAFSHGGAAIQPIPTSKSAASGGKKLNAAADAIFTQLDAGESGILSIPQIISLYEQLHSSTGECTPALVQQVLDAMQPNANSGGVCTRANLLEVLSNLQVACQQSSQLRWDWRVLDSEEFGTLPVRNIDSAATSILTFPSHSELLWNCNLIDSTSQPKYDEYLTRKAKQEKMKAKELRFGEIQTELCSKIVSVG